ncbi:MAG: Plasmid pRiA4b ORF-3-like protein [Verrucomicrobiales bacterium]|nr:Plasmid pRiA4b ORF-3-like protein [Verrucomicrobiales bacterium]
MKNASTIHRLNVSLDQVFPPIWRRIEIESDVPLDFVAEAIRCAFGWSFTHGCEFNIKQRRYGTPNGWARFDPEQDFYARERAINKQKLDSHQHRKAMDELFGWYQSVPKTQDDDEDSIPSLGELIKRAGAKFIFIFDFGDCWSHTIRVEKIEPALSGIAYPRCIDGAGANPLEDCGGPRNLMAVFEAIQNPERSRNEIVDRIVKEWVGDGWDFTHFSVDEANQRFRKTFSRSKR